MTHEQKNPPGTTHADWGAGDPRLLVTSESGRFVHELTERKTLIGSSPECGLRLEGLDAVHAMIRHDSQDEYVLSLRGPGETSAIVRSEGDADGAGEEVLRTGARFVLGGWSFVFSREEFADHGRPFGGREGGELSDQRPQGDRPDYPSTSAGAKAAAEDERRLRGGS